jgi:hypothetical protein
MTRKRDSTRARVLTCCNDAKRRTHHSFTVLISVRRRREFCTHSVRNGILASHIKSRAITR